MPLALQEAQEEDIPRLLDIMYAAFHEDPWNRIMIPQIPPQNARATSTNRWRKDILNKNQQRFMTVVDLEGEHRSEIIAFAQWDIYETERPESEWKSEARREYDEGWNVDAANEFFGGFQEKRRTLIAGKPHCCEFVENRSN